MESVLSLLVLPVGYLIMFSLTLAIFSLIAYLKRNDIKYVGKKSVIFMCFFLSAVWPLVWPTFIVLLFGYALVFSIVSFFKLVA